MRMLPSAAPPAALALFGATLLLAAAVSSAPPAAAQPAQDDDAKSKVIYVSDFELDAAALQSDTAPLAPRAKKSPQAEAQHIVSLMTDSLVKDLKKRGYTAEPVDRSVPLSGQNYVVKGIFAQLDESHRLRRALLGSASAASFQLYVSVDDLARPAQPLYRPSPQDAGGNAPGALIIPNPLAAKFALDGDPTDKLIKQTAKEIAAEVVNRLNGHTQPQPAGAGTEGLKN